MANDMIRMSGMNSGLDTESIINALTANSKLKVTKQERNLLKYEATQEAYQDITSKITALKNKYFDVLNKDSNLSGTSLWNKYSATTYVDGLEKTVPGLAVSTTINSQPGEYNVKIKNTAKQSTYTGKSLSTSAKVSDDELRDLKNQTVGVTVNVGGVEKSITFAAGNTPTESRNNLNQALEDAFGESNDSVGEASNKGMVYTVPSELSEFSEWVKDNPTIKELYQKYGGSDNVYSWANRAVNKPSAATVSIDEGDPMTKEELFKQVGDEFAKFKDFYAEKYNGATEGQIISRSGKGVTISGFSAMSESNTLELANAKSGTNTVSIQVGEETVNASFQTIDKDYFKSAVKYGIIDDDNGTVVGISDKDDNGDNIRFKMAEQAAVDALKDEFKDRTEFTEEEINSKASEIREEWSKAVTLYQSVTDDMKEAARYDAFKAWKADVEAGTADYDIDDLYESALKTQEKTLVSSWLEADEETKTAYDAYVKTAQDSNTPEKDIQDIYTWASSQGDKGTVKFQELTQKYNGTADSAEVMEPKYMDYVFSKLPDGTRDRYNAYVENTPEDDRVSLETWMKDSSLSQLSEDDIKDIQSWEDWKKDYQESKSYKLDKDMWSSSESNLFTAFKADKKFYDEEAAEYDLDQEKVVKHFLKSSIQNSIGNLETSDGTKFEVDFEDDNSVSIKAYKEEPGTDEDGNPTTVRNYEKASITIAKGSANTAADLNGGVDSTSTVSQISNTTKLADLGATPDSDGMYKFTINNKEFSFDGNTTVNDMMKKINASSAGVKMTYSSLDNAFTLTSTNYGVDSEINIGKDNNGLLGALGIEAEKNITNGSNLVMEINGHEVESTGNSVELDGTTFTFSGSEDQVGKEMTISIGRDTSAIADVIKGFIKEYNQLIDDVYKYLDEKPEKDYYFLSDQDKEDLDLSEKQEEKWEEKAKKGLLYHDSTVTSAMSKLRTALMGSVEGLDGNTFSLSSLGLKTMTDYNQHGKFADIDEKALMEAIETHTDDIQKLFTDSENGIMKQFSSALDAAVGTTGSTKGTLIRKAGLKSGTSSTDNEIYNMIKRTKVNIASLTKRYENEQDRLWKRYSAMESMLGSLNSQQSSFNSYFGGM